MLVARNSSWICAQQGKESVISPIGLDWIASLQAHLSHSNLMPLPPSLTEARLSAHVHPLWLFLWLSRDPRPHSIGFSGDLHGMTPSPYVSDVPESAADQPASMQRRGVLERVLTTASRQVQLSTCPGTGLRGWCMHQYHVLLAASSMFGCVIFVS